MPNIVLTETKHFYVHLISDATGNTLQGLARACLAQFEGIDPIERFWPLIRTEKQMERVFEDIADCPGPVLFTLVDSAMRRKLQKFCRQMQLPCLPVLDPLIKGLSTYLGIKSMDVPGLQYTMDDAYFERVYAVDFALSFDDGQNLDGIEMADVILVGVSRTSKTPTCIFLARRGIRAANIPFIPALPFPEHVLDLEKPLFIGLTETPDRLVHLRHSRLRAEEEALAVRGHHNENTYLDLEQVENEIRIARRFFTKHNWPVIDVTRRSIEETAAEIIILLQNRNKIDLHNAE